MRVYTAVPRCVKPNRTQEKFTEMARMILIMNEDYLIL